MIIIIFLQGIYTYFELGVSPNDPNTPVVYSITDGIALNSMVFHIQSFTPGAPPSTTFNVPLMCGGPSQEMKHMHYSPQLVMPPYMLDLTGERFKSMLGVGKP